MFPQYNNLLNYPMSFSQPQNILKVNGIEGAKAYQMAPNSMAALFDTNEDIFYIKTSDSGGFSNVQAYSFKKIEEKPVQAQNDFVTRKEFEELKEALNGKLNIREHEPKSFDDAATV